MKQLHTPFKLCVASWLAHDSEGSYGYEKDHMASYLTCRPPQPDLANWISLVILTLLLAHLTCWANPPDYLTNDIEPAIRAGELASLFA